MKRLVLMLCACSSLLLAGEATTPLQDALTAYKAGDLGTAKSLFESVLISDPKNLTAKNHLRLITQKLAKSSALKASLDAILLTKLELKDVSAREAFDYTAQAINKQSKDGFRLNLIWMVPEEYPNRVNLSLDNIPASADLEYLASNAGLRIAFEDYAVKISVPTP